MDHPTTTSSNQFLSGLFTDKHNAENAYEQLRAMSYMSEEINVAMTSTTKDKLYGNLTKSSETERNIKIPFDGTTEGAALGGIIGGIAFTIGALGSNLFIPGLGLVLMGPVAAGLLGVGAGGLTGGWLGHILSPEQPKTQRDLCTEGLKNGKILIAICPHQQNDIKKITASWKKLGAQIVTNSTCDE